MPTKQQLKNNRIIIAVSTIIIVMTIAYVQKHYLVVHNKSESLPNHWFVISKGQIPHKNQIFAFKAKDNPAYKAGEIFIKIAGGVSGDEVKITERNFFINDQFIGTAKTESLKGLPLEMSDAGIIPEHSFFAYTTHKDSYDSRYKEIGLINEQDIIGTAVLAF